MSIKITSPAAKEIAAPSNALESPSAELSALLSAVNRITSRLMSVPSATGLDISIPDWQLLRYVGEGGAASIAEAARKMGVSRQRVHQQVVQLEAAKFLALSSGEDAKPRKLSLSAAGHKLIQRIDEGFREALAKDGDVTTKHIHNARRNVQKVAQALAPAKDDSAGHTEA